MKLQVMRTSPDARVKTPPHPGDAGLDVYTTERVTLLPGRVTRVQLGFNMALPPDVACTTITRSGSVADGLFVLPGLIDNGYRGPMYLFVLNTNPEPKEVFPGESIGQLVFLPILSTGVEIEYVNELPPSSRGSSGFGSTGGGRSQQWPPKP